MNIRHWIISTVSAAALACAGNAYAVFLDFDALPASTNLSGVPNNAASILTTQLAASDGIVFGRAGVSTGVAVIDNLAAALSDPNSISGLDASGQLTANVAGDMYFNFVDPTNIAALGVTDLLSFAIGDDGGDVDSWTIRAFDVSNTLIDTQMLSGVSHQTYTLAMPGIHRLFIENTTGTTFGFGVDNMSFNLPTGINGVPEPTTLALLGLGLAGLGFARKRLH